MIGSIGGLVLLTLVVGSVVMYRTRHKRECLIIVLGGISLLIIQMCTLKYSGNYHIFLIAVILVSQKNSCRKLCKYKSIWRIFLRSVSFIICSMCHDSYLISQERARGSREERKYRQSGYLAP